MMSHKGHREKAVFEVCDLGKTLMILGHLWLKKHNLEVDWITGAVQMMCCPRECNVFLRSVKKEKHRKKVAARWAYKVSLEEDSEEPELVMDDEEEEELDRFIRKTEQPAS